MYTSQRYAVDVSSTLRLTFFLLQLKNLLNLRRLPVCEFAVAPLLY